MYSPTTRVLAVLELLQTHGRLSGAALAARLDIDTRTLRRYIATLEQMGIPVMAERGRFGGYALMPGFRLPPMMFTDDETLALSVGLLAARQLGFAESAPAVASAQAKIERILPPTLRQRIRALTDTVRVDVAHGTALADNVALTTLSAAALARQRVQLRYRSVAGEESVREIDPYGLALHEGSWYVVGMCHLRAAIRTFRLDRVLHAAPRPASFAPPAQFDPLLHLRRSIASMPRAHPVEVLIRAGLPCASSYFSDTLGAFEPVAGGVLLRCDTDHLDWFARKLAGMPFSFEVRAPDALRDSLAALAAQLLISAARPAPAST